MQYQQGVITRIDGKACIIHSGEENIRAYIPRKIKGVDKNSTKPVCVGDRVKFTTDEANEVMIRKVEPRTSKLSRRAIGPVEKEQIVASNVEQLLIVTSVFSPPFHPALIDRFIIAALCGNLNPILCINKMDLIDQDKSREKIEKAVETYQQLDYPVIYTSAESGQGIDELRNLLKDKSTVVGGHSGVGKSSLLQAVDPNLQLKTTEVNEKTRRGRHTTTSVNLLPIDVGGYVVDTPGIRELSLWKIQPEEVGGYFPEISVRKGGCKYRTCTHTHEPSCTVKEAVQNGEIEEFRYDSYFNILDSLENDSLASRPQSFAIREKDI